ncbi:DUF1275 domain-containing protein [Belliella sp. DSM 107340]|uniref:DUF1275 domain-containing protein n=1 Tax=Belliella calami TaxID=2923436 RepID=A0ABS9UJN0_9BACT|nr:YoaK family protein [Belliella calami]MCH7396370.1 DUF1275 domain-containing protein [Belliella calami]
MLRKHSSSRTLKDNLQLGSLTAFSAGMVNVTSLIIFFAFTSNVTGHYAILAEEIAKGNWNQVLMVFFWLFMFFYGNFLANFLVISSSRSNYIAHALPLILETICLSSVGFYGLYYYQETLFETEILIAIMLLAMGLQNGLTASISNSAVKTTHMTGLTTDLAILVSMFTKKKFRENRELRNKAKLLSTIAVSYISGGVIAGLIYFAMGFKVFFMVSLFLIFIILYDYIKFRFNLLLRKRRLQGYGGSKRLKIKEMWLERIKI